MVYCTKCGTKNPDDATTCSNCGAALNPTREERRRHYRRYEQECFGIPHGGAIVGIAFGLIIVLAGMIIILQQENIIPETVDIWPFALIILGLLILIGALYRMGHRY
jgi:uncharacterized membrane protein YvbJ